MLTQQCFFFSYVSYNVTSIFVLWIVCIYDRTVYFDRPQSLLLYGRPCPSWNLTSIKFGFNFLHVIMKSLSMVSEVHETT